MSFPRSLSIFWFVYFYIFSDHQRVAEILAQNMHSERGKGSQMNGRGLWKIVYIVYNSCLVMFRWCSWGRLRRYWMWLSRLSSSVCRSHFLNRSPTASPAPTFRSDSCVILLLIIMIIYPLTCTTHYKQSLGLKVCFHFHLVYSIHVKSCL